MVLTLFNPSLFFIGSDIPLLLSKCVLTLRSSFQTQQWDSSPTWDISEWMRCAIWDNRGGGGGGVPCFGTDFCVLTSSDWKHWCFQSLICLMQNKLCIYWSKSTMKVHTAISILLSDYSIIIIDLFLTEVYLQCKLIPDFFFYFILLTFYFITFFNHSLHQNKTDYFQLNVKTFFPVTTYDLMQNN